MYEHSPYNAFFDKLLDEESEVRCTTKQREVWMRKCLSG